MPSSTPVLFEMDPTLLLTSVLCCSQFEADVQVLRLRGAHPHPGSVETITGTGVEMVQHFETLRSGFGGTQRPFFLA